VRNERCGILCKVDCNASAGEITGGCWFCTGDTEERENRAESAGAKTWEGISSAAAWSTMEQWRGWPAGAVAGGGT